MSEQQKIDFRTAFEAANGISSHIIVVFADVRGFSDFSKATDATDVATYIKRVYLRIADMFPDANFFKATGDGLLIAIPCDESDVGTKSEEVIKSCLSIVDHSLRSVVATRW